MRDLDVDIAYLRLKGGDSPRIVQLMAAAMSLYARTTGKTDYPPSIFEGIRRGDSPEAAVNAVTMTRMTTSSGLPMPGQNVPTMNNVTSFREKLITGKITKEQTGEVFDALRGMREDNVTLTRTEVGLANGLLNAIDEKIASWPKAPGVSDPNYALFNNLHGISNELFAIIEEQLKKLSASGELSDEEVDANRSKLGLPSLAEEKANKKSGAARSEEIGLTEEVKGRIVSSLEKGVLPITRNNTEELYMREQAKKLGMDIPKTRAVPISPSDVHEKIKVAKQWISDYRKDKFSDDRIRDELLKRHFTEAEINRAFTEEDSGATVDIGSANMSSQEVDDFAKKNKLKSDRELLEHILNGDPNIEDMGYDENEIVAARNELERAIGGKTREPRPARMYAPGKVQIGSANMSSQEVEDFAKKYGFSFDFEMLEHILNGDDMSQMGYDNQEIKDARKELQDAAHLLPDTKKRVIARAGKDIPDKVGTRQKELISQGWDPTAARGQALEDAVPDSNEKQQGLHEQIIQGDSLESMVGMDWTTSEISKAERELKKAGWKGEIGKPEPTKHDDKTKDGVRKASSIKLGSDNDFSSQEVEDFKREHKLTSDEELLEHVLNGKKTEDFESMGYESKEVAVAKAEIQNVIKPGSAKGEGIQPISREPSGGKFDQPLRGGGTLGSYIGSLRDVGPGGRGAGLGLNKRGATGEAYSAPEDYAKNVEPQDVGNVRKAIALELENPLSPDQVNWLNGVLEAMIEQGKTGSSPSGSGLSSSKERAILGNLHGDMADLTSVLGAAYGDKKRQAGLGTNLSHQREIKEIGLPNVGALHGKIMNVYWALPTNNNPAISSDRASRQWQVLRPEILSTLDQMDKVPGGGKKTVQARNIVDRIDSNFVRIKKGEKKSD